MQIQIFALSLHQQSKTITIKNENKMVAKKNIKEYLSQGDVYSYGVAKTIYNQIKHYTDWTVRASWGIHGFCNCYYQGKPALMFSVSGFVHKGKVIIALNKGADLYEVTLASSKFNENKVIKGVYEDMLTTLLDSEIEKPASQTESEYKQKVDNAVYCL